MRYLDRLRAGDWQAVALFLAIALASLVILALMLKKTNPGHLTVGSLMVMLIYLTVGAFMVLAARLFVSKEGEERR